MNQINQCKAKGGRWDANKNTCISIASKQNRNPARPILIIAAVFVVIVAVWISFAIWTKEKIESSSIIYEAWDEVYNAGDPIPPALSELSKTWGYVQYPYTPGDSVIGSGEIAYYKCYDTPSGVRIIGIDMMGCYNWIANGVLEGGINIITAQEAGTYVECKPNDCSGNPNGFDSKGCELWTRSETRCYYDGPWPENKHTPSSKSPPCTGYEFGTYPIYGETIVYNCGGSIIHQTVPTGAAGGVKEAKKDGQPYLFYTLTDDDKTCLYITPPYGDKLQRICKDDDWVIFSNMGQGTSPPGGSTILPNADGLGFDSHGETPYMVYRKDIKNLEVDISFLNIHPSTTNGAAKIFINNVLAADCKEACTLTIRNSIEPNKKFILKNGDLVNQITIDQDYAFLKIEVGDGGTQNSDHHADIYVSATMKYFYTKPRYSCEQGDGNILGEQDFIGPRDISLYSTKEPVNAFCSEHAADIIDLNTGSSTSTDEIYYRLGNGEVLSIPQGQIWTLKYIFYNDGRYPFGCQSYQLDDKECKNTTGKVYFCGDGTYWSEELSACIASTIPACISGKFDSYGNCITAINLHYICEVGFQNKLTGKCEYQQPCLTGDVYNPSNHFCEAFPLKVVGCMSPFAYDPNTDRCISHMTSEKCQEYTGTYEGDICILETLSAVENSCIDGTLYQMEGTGAFVCLQKPTEMETKLRSDNTILYITAGALLFALTVLIIMVVKRK